jgi:hypothetical protein
MRLFKHVMLGFNITDLGSGLPRDDKLWASLVTVDKHG